MGCNRLKANLYDGLWSTVRDRTVQYAVVCKPNVGLVGWDERIPMQQLPIKRTQSGWLVREQGEPILVTVLLCETIL